MARKRYTAEQIIGHLRQAEILISQGKTIGETACQLSADFGESFHPFRFKVATDRSEATLVFVMM